MKRLLIIVVKFLKKILIIEWTGFDLNYKSVDYVIGHYRLYEKIKNVPGHIIELGTGSGRNSLIFGRFISINHQEKYKKVYGFDTFKGYPKNVLELNKNLDSKSHKEFSFQDVNLRMEQNQLSQIVTLIQGVLPNSIEDFLKTKDHAFSKGSLKISLIYVDCNDFETAKKSLMILKDYLSVGAIIAVDENRLGGETKALDFFSKQMNLPIKQWQSGGVISSYIKV
jgi:hypothetical protein